MMRKVRTRVWSTLIAVAMLLTMLPTMARPSVESSRVLGRVFCIQGLKRLAPAGACAETFALSVSSVRVLVPPPKQPLRRAVHDRTAIVVYRAFFMRNPCGLDMVGKWRPQAHACGFPVRPIFSYSFRLFRRKKRCAASRPG